MQSDTQITTITQQIDAQGPVVVDRITTQFSELACTQENARQLVEALHSGKSVTLSANGKTATFTPATGTHLGYGEAYIALALAAEALRNAGVSGCATPDQWQAVLMGGPLAAAGTVTTSTSRSATASSSSSFPGILALHAQGQGWGQIAQTTNVQLGQIVSNAQSSLKLSSTGDTTSTLAPTGRSSTTGSSQNPSATSTTGSTSGGSKSSTSGKDDENDRDKDKDKDNSRDKSNDRSSYGTGASSSSTNPSSSSSSSSTSPRDR